MKTLSLGLARFFWGTLPKLISHLSSTLAAGLSDGPYLYRLRPQLVFVLPIGLLLGFAIGAWHPTFNHEATYTASLAAMGLMLLGSLIAGSLGVFMLFGYGLGEFLLFRPDTSYAYEGIELIIRQRVPMILSYVLLGLLLIGVPLAGRGLSRMTLTRLKLAPKAQLIVESILGVVLTAVFVYFWAQSTATLIRPLYTWLKHVPTLEAIAPLQRTGWVLSIIAAIGYVLRVILEQRAARSAGAALQIDRPAVQASPTARWPIWLRAPLSSLGTAFLLAGLLSEWYDTLIVVGGVVLIQVGREFLLPRMKTWTRLASKVPLLIRIVIGLGLIYFVATNIIGAMWGNNVGFTPVAISVVLAMFILALLLPDTFQRPSATRSAGAASSISRSTTLMLLLFLWLAVPQIVYADNCGGLSDCYQQIAIAVVVVMAIAIAVALLPELLAAGAAEAAIGGVEAAEAAEAAAAAAEAAEAAEAASAAAEAAEAASAAAEAGEAAEAAEVAEGAAEAAEAGAEDLTSEAIDMSNPGEWAGEVNPNYGEPGYDVNCGKCIDGVNSWLEGNPANAAEAGQDGGWDAIADRYGSSWEWDGNSFESIYNEVSSGGPGTRGVVGISDGTTSHVFNVANVDGTTTFIEGQTGQVFNSAAEAANAYSSFGVPSGSLGYLPLSPF